MNINHWGICFLIPLYKLKYWLFCYLHDKLNRLTSGISDEGFNETISYDVMGNIKTMNRNPMGLNTCTYSGNRLSSISGFLSGSFGYDANGNQTSDNTKGVAIAYNQLNHPQTITKASTSIHGLLTVLS